MDFQEVVKRILLTCPNLTREEILKKIEDTKREAKGYLTDEGASRIVASELYVKLYHEQLSNEVAIVNLVSGLSDVTVAGRVIIIYPVQSYLRSNGTEMKVASLFISDKTGAIRTVLWNEKASLMNEKKIEEGQVIRVSHGYVKESMDGKLELHVRSHCDINISPPDVTESDYPSVMSFIMKIGELTNKTKKTNVIGIIRIVYPESEFMRKDGTKGKMRRLRLEDESGQINVVLWNEKVNELSKLRKDDRLQIMDARVKERLDGELELHVENRVQVSILKKAI